MTDQPEPTEYGPPMPPPRDEHSATGDKPGIIPLRPLGVGDILSGAISAIRARPAQMLGVAAVVAIITQLFTLAVTYPLLGDVDRALEVDERTTSSELWDLTIRTLAASGIGALLTFVMGVFLSGFLTQVVGGAVIGESLTFARAWTRLRPRLLPLLGLTLIYLAVALLAVLVTGGLALVSPELAVLALIPLIVAGTWLAILFSLATPALVLEGVGVLRAFDRSRQLVHGAWWRIFGITVLAALISVAVSAVVQLPFRSSDVLVSSIGVVLSGTITQPFVAAVVVLLYVDQRIRRGTWPPS